MYLIQFPKKSIYWITLIFDFQNVSAVLDKITDHVQELRDTVADNLISTAKSSIDDLRKSLPDFSEVSKDISSIHVKCSRSVPRSILSAEEAINMSAHFPASRRNSISHEWNWK